VQVGLAEGAALAKRCITENKDGWRCEDRSGQDFCPDHVSLSDPKRIRPKASFWKRFLNIAKIQIR
jgi:hypothetical protein